MAADSAGRGPAVDAKGAPVVDPSENVKALSDAANKRQDDLRDFIKQLFDRELVALRRELETFARHQRELDKAESDRLDSIRQVDREDVNKTATQTLAAVQTLAATTTTTAETLRNQVATTALQAANQRAQDQAETNKRLSALELASSEGKGKQAVADPQLADLVIEMRRLAAATQTSTGKSEGVSAAWAIVLAVLGVGGMLFGLLRP